MYFILKWETVISMIFVVPALTMRLLSEERRTGSLEVMLTAPINETSVVLSKFFAAIIFYLLLWVPWSLFFVGLRVQGGEQFDYYPFQSFFIALAASGAGFLSMGLFFSSLTKNQIIAAMLTFAAMLPLTFIFFINQSLPSDSIWHALIKYVSYVELWLDACRGSLSAKHLMFHCSTAVFWLFLTVKVLESRKWR